MQFPLLSRTVGRCVETQLRCPIFCWCMLTLTPTAVIVICVRSQDDGKERKLSKREAAKKLRSGTQSAAVTA